MLVVVAAIAVTVIGQPPGQAVEADDRAPDIVVEMMLTFLTSDDLGSVGADLPLLGTVVTPVLDNGDAGLYSPFKQPLTYDPEASATASISHTFALAVNPSADPITLPYTVDNAVGYAGGETGAGAAMGVLPPLRSDGSAETFGEFTLDLAGGFGLSPEQLESLDGSGLRAVWPEIPDDLPLDGQPVYLLGARTETPRPLDCPGVFRESGVFFDTPLVNWDDTTGADSVAFDDFFYAGDSAVVTGCGDGDPFGPQNLITFQGPGANPLFADALGSGLIVVGPYGWMMVVNGADVPGAQAVRWFEFLTDAMAPRNPDYTVASATPADLTTLVPLGSTTHLYFDETLIPVETTSTTQPAAEATTTTAAVSTPSSEATTTSLAAIDPPADGSGFPFPLLIFLGLAIIAIGIWLWWRTWMTATVATTTSGTTTTAPPATSPPATSPPSTLPPGTAVVDDTTVVVPPPSRPGKGAGTDTDAPPLVGLRGWKL